MSFLSAIANLFRRKPYQPPGGVFPVNTTPGRVNDSAVPLTSEADLLRAAMDAGGITDPETRAGIAAIAMGESQMRGQTEMGWGGGRDPVRTRARIRQLFGLRVAGLSDAALEALRHDDRAFFNRVYGSQFAIGRQLGNAHPDDGFRFRGRGFIQLTGRGNYARYAAKIGRPEIIEDPDLANDPEISALLTVAYIKDRYHGGGWDALMACVGTNTPDIRATKTAYFRRFMASGEYAAR